MCRKIFVSSVLLLLYCCCAAVYATDYEIYDPELSIEGNRAEVRFSVGEPVEQEGPEYDTVILYWEGGVNTPPFNNHSVVCKAGTSECYTVDALLQQNYRIKFFSLYASGNSAIVILERKNIPEDSDE